MERNKIKPEEVVMNVIGFLMSILIAPFMLLFAFGLPLLAIASLYFFLTIGNFEYLLGALIFGAISFVMWDETAWKLSTFIKGKSKSVLEAPMTDSPQNQNIKDLKKEHTNTHEIPKGLHKCGECGEYKGQMIEKDEEVITISCLCEGILCPKCKKNKIRRPTSNYYDEGDNLVWHDSYFTAQFGCVECREKQKREEQNEPQKPEEKSELQIILHRKNPSNLKNDDNE